MLSAMDHVLRNPFAAFDGGFTPWDCPDFLSAQSDPVTSCSGSDGPNLTPSEEKPGSDESNRDVSIMDERKRRRMISNRESARRSRMRKQRHLENLRNQANVFRVENRELKNRLEVVLHHCNRQRTENEWLRSERTILLQKLNDMTQFLFCQQFQQPCFSSSATWPCYNN